MGTFTAYGGDSSFVLENAMYGTPFVETTYSTDIFSTLDAGFTCTSGRKYVATIDNILLLKDAYITAKTNSITTITVLLFDNTSTSITISALLVDITELMQNYYNTVVYDY